MNRRILYAFSFCSLLFLSVNNSFAMSPSKDCQDASDKATQACNAAAQGVNGADNAASSAAGNALKGTNTINPGAGAQSGTCAPQSANAAKLANQCKQMKAACEQRCQTDLGRVPGYCKSTRPNDPSCQGTETSAVNNAKTVCDDIDDQIGQASNAAGQAGSCNDQSKDTQKASNMQIPPMQMPSQSADNSSPSPSPTAVASATDSTATSGTGASTLLDGGSAGTFLAPKAATQLASANTGSLNLASTGTTSGMGTSSVGGGSTGGASGSSGSSSSGMGTASTDDKKNTKDKASGAEGSVSGMAPDNQYGTDGAGGMASASASAEGSSLEAYLPGGKKDPTKRDPAKAGMNTASAHPDIVSQNESLFNVVSKRMHLMCDLKEFIGCN